MSEMRSSESPAPFSVLFLDVDGVLNQCGKSNQGLMTDQCDRLADVCRRTGCKVVVSSAWRRYPHLMEDRLLPMFRSRGIDCYGWTPMLEIPNPGGSIVIASPRRSEIDSWLAGHPEVTRYAIVDDDADADNGTGKFVKTRSDEGLLESHVNALIRLLSPLPADSSQMGEACSSACSACGQEWYEGVESECIKRGRCGFRSAVTVDSRTFATPLEAAMHLLWLIQRLSYCEPNRDGMPADGPRMREVIRESRKLIAQLGYEPGKPFPNPTMEAR